MRLLVENINSGPWANHKQRSEFLTAEKTINRKLVRETNGSDWCGVLGSVGSTSQTLVFVVETAPIPRWLLCMATRPVGEGFRQASKKQEGEYNAAFEPELGWHGTFYGYRGF